MMKKKVLGLVIGTSLLCCACNSNPVAAFSRSQKADVTFRQPLCKIVSKKAQNLLQENGFSVKVNRYQDGQAAHIFISGQGLNAELDCHQQGTGTACRVVRSTLVE